MSFSFHIQFLFLSLSHYFSFLYLGYMDFGMKIAFLAKGGCRMKISWQIGRKFHIHNGLILKTQKVLKLGKTRKSLIETVQCKFANFHSWSHCYFLDTFGCKFTGEGEGSERKLFRKIIFVTLWRFHKNFVLQH